MRFAANEKIPRRTCLFLGVVWIALACRGIPAAAAEEGAESLPFSYNLPAEWLTDLEAARVQSMTTKKPILVFGGSGECIICRIIADKAFPAAGLKAALEKFTVVYVDAEKDQTTAARFAITRGPTFIFLDEAGEPSDRWVGYPGSSGLTRYIEGFKAKWERIGVLRKRTSENPLDSAAWEEMGDLLSRGKALYGGQPDTLEIVEAYSKAAAASPEAALRLRPKTDFTKILALPEFAGARTDLDQLEAVAAAMRGYLATYPDGPFAPAAAYHIARGLAHIKQPRDCLDALRGAREKHGASSFAPAIEADIELFEIIVNWQAEQARSAGQ